MGSNAPLKHYEPNGLKEQASTFLHTENVFVTELLYLSLLQTNQTTPVTKQTVQ